MTERRNVIVHIATSVNGYIARPDGDLDWLTSRPAPDPDALAAEYVSRGVQFSEPLKDTHDGLRGFELKDADGYVLFFGRPRT